MLNTASRIAHPVRPPQCCYGGRASRFPFPGSRNARHASRIPRPSPLDPRPSERGVALVITLVLLSVITFMAVTFLVVSRSQHGSVATETDQAIARLAADNARERAIAQLVAPIMAWTNEFNYGLLVSANYINPAGFTNGGVGPLNVNYDYKVGGSTNFSALEWEQNIANLLYDPRPPVFIATNSSGPSPNDFRFYLDLNRNGRYDPSGLQPVISSDPHNPYYNVNGSTMPSPTPGNTLSNFFVGDPEWIGALQHPEFAHSANNRFVYRYAYLAVPAGQTLDLNCIHNEALASGGSKFNPLGFLRNQGVGTFEINLAAFLYDLNTNLYAWGGSYRYNPIGNFQPAGNAFADAGALLAYRYALNPANYSYTLASVSQLFGAAGINAFERNFIDGYSGGPPMVGTWWAPAGPLNSRVLTPWAGADNANHFYSTQDLFDKTKTALGLGKTYSFTDRLLAAGAKTNSYDGYTFYRLLSQLGTDSAPEPGGKMNLNYCNVDANGYVVPNMATNFIPWTNAAQFFTNAAIRLLADAGYAVGAYYSTSNLLVFGSNYVNNFWITTTNLHIPLWPTNYYTPSVHRLFQLAANIYDATTNRNFNVATATNGFPTVFRPIFLNGLAVKSSGIFINGFQEVTDASLVLSTTPMRDLQLASDRAQLKPNDMIYGQPIVIGAKKGFPSFNQFSMQTVFQITRKLQFLKHQATDRSPYQTNQMYLVGISNTIGVEAWNSYSSAYPRGLQPYAKVTVNARLFGTNSGSVFDLLNINFSRPANPNVTRVALPPVINGNTWVGFTNPNYVQVSFQIPLHPSTNTSSFLTNATYRSMPQPHFDLLSSQFAENPPQCSPNSLTGFPDASWWLSLRTRIFFSLVDTNVTPHRIVDYVNLDHTEDALDIATNLIWTDGLCGDPGDPSQADGHLGSMFCTNRGGYPNPCSPTRGVYNQIAGSFLGPPPGGLKNLIWSSYSGDAPPGFDVPGSVNFFRTNLNQSPARPGPFRGHLYLTNEFYSPYVPTRSIYLFTSCQASDPLVHYTVRDLNWTSQVYVDDATHSPTANLGLDVNQRYEPWGYPLGNPRPTTYQLNVKDPLATRSDNWDFPTNKLPNVGWLGRVHRGTPWQTVYLKSPGVDLSTWTNWTGNGLFMTNAGQTALFARNTAYYDAFLTQPTNDWRLVDLFTTALSDNATRGQLSINQTNLAAWSAVLSGVMVLSNDVTGNLLPTIIQPAGAYNPFDATTWPPLVQLVKRINDVRATNSTRHVFSRLGDILAVPELTVASPFLNTSGTPSLGNSGLNDAAYERLPQQILGLLKCDHTPRFVIYAVGQTLKPAPHSIVPNGSFAGLCTNYQIMAEAATRTVVRLEGVQLSPPGFLPPPIATLHPVIESFNVLPPD